LITIVHKHRVTVHKHHQIILKTRLSKDQVIRKKLHRHQRNTTIEEIRKY